MFDHNKDSEYFLELQTETGWGNMLSSFARWAAPAAGQRVLDVACGPGLLPALFSKQGLEAYGSDIDPKMFVQALHSKLLVADIFAMPFNKECFNLITISNLLYLIDKPKEALLASVQLLKKGGQICLLNPSEKMSIQAAEQLADERQLTGIARDTLLNYGRRAETCFRWSVAEYKSLFAAAGLQFTDTILKMGPGLVRFTRGEKVQ